MGSIASCCKKEGRLAVEWQRRGRKPPRSRIVAQSRKIPAVTCVSVCKPLNPLVLTKVSKMGGKEKKKRETTKKKNSEDVN